MSVHVLGIRSKHILRVCSEVCVPRHGPGAGPGLHKRGAAAEGAAELRQGHPVV